MFRNRGRKRKAAPEIDKYVYPVSSDSNISGDVSLPKNESPKNESPKNVSNESPKKVSNLEADSYVVPRLLETPQSNNIVNPSHRIRGVLSDALKYSGNSKVWNDVMQHIEVKQCQPCLVWGPTGVGKTFGIKDIANVCGLRVYEIEPSILDSTENLRKWLHHITQSKTLLGPRMILVDVLEGFDVSFLIVFEKFVKKHPHLSIPLVFVVDDAYNIALKNLMSLLSVKFRLFKMNPQRCFAFAKQTFARIPPNDVNPVVVNSWDSMVKDACERCNGNLRNLRCRLSSSTINFNFCFKFGGPIPHNISSNMYFESMDDSLSLFETTNRFLLGQVDCNTWVQCAEKTTLLHLIADNYMRFLSDIDAAWEVSEQLSSSYMISYAEHQNCDFDLISCGTKLKNLCNFTNVPRMTLLANPRVKRLKSTSTLQDYLHSFSRLDTSSLLLSSETFCN